MGGERKVFTLDEVSQHNSPKDCWLVIDGKVCRLFFFIIMPMFFLLVSLLNHSYYAYSCWLDLDCYWHIANLMLLGLLTFCFWSRVSLFLSFFMVMENFESGCIDLFWNFPLCAYLSACIILGAIQTIFHSFCFVFLTEQNLKWDLSIGVECTSVFAYNWLIQPEWSVFSLRNISYHNLCGGKSRIIKIRYLA